MDCLLAVSSLPLFLRSKELGLDRNKDFHKQPTKCRSVETTRLNHKTCTDGIGFYQVLGDENDEPPTVLNGVVDIIIIITIIIIN